MACSRSQRGGVELQQQQQRPRRSALSVATYYVHAATLFDNTPVACYRT